MVLLLRQISCWLWHNHRNSVHQPHTHNVEILTVLYRRCHLLASAKWSPIATIHPSKPVEASSVPRFYGYTRLIPRDLRYAWCLRDSPYSGHLRWTSNPVWSDPRSPFLLLDALPLTVETYRSSPFLLLSGPSWLLGNTPNPIRTRFRLLLGGVPHHPRLPSVPCKHGVLPTPPNGRPRSVSAAAVPAAYLEENSGHFVVRPNVFFDTLDRIQAGPKSQAILLIPDPALVKFSSEVTEWLHAQVQLLLSPI